MKAVSRALLVSLTLCCCVGCDQVTKSAARSFLAGGAVHAYLADALRLELVENTGSFLSLGAALPPAARFGLFVASVGVLLAAMVAVALFARVDRASSLALAMVAGGGIGNFIDRLARDGRVTDFLNVGVGTLRTGIFNVADMVILAGALLLVLRYRRLSGEAAA